MMDNLHGVVDEIYVRHNGSQTGDLWKVIESCSISVLIFIMFIFSVFGNIVVIGTMSSTWYNTVNKTSNHLVFLLSILDLFNSFFNMPFAFATSILDDWVFGDTICRLQGILFVFLTSCANNVLCMISMNRLFLIQNPNINKRIARLRSKKMMAYCFANGAVIVSCFLLPWGSIGFQKEVDIICVPMWQSNALSLVVMTFVWTLSYFLPLAIMVVSYCKICLIIKARVQKITPALAYAISGSVRFISSVPGSKADFTAVASQNSFNSTPNGRKFDHTHTTERYRKLLYVLLQIYTYREIKAPSMAYIKG